MALQEQGRPPSYSHDPDTLHLPSVPSKELPPIPPSEGVHLPDFKSLRLPESNRHHLPPLANGDGAQWHGLLPLNQNVFPPVPSGALRTGPEDVGSPMDFETAILDDHVRYPRSASVSMEDPDVRTAAEALTGLRSPSNRNLPAPNGHPAASNEPEPLLSLLTSSHPWLGGTINHSLSAYATTKHYSPRFVRNVAESVERNIGTPVANTVSAVGRRTGVEDGLRRYLGTHRRSSDLERGDADAELGGSKRRRLEPATEQSEMEIGPQTPLSLRTRTDSQVSQPDSLPAYDDHRSPRYEEIGTQVAVRPAQSQSQQEEERRNWSTQLMITTSGLGAALNEAALRNLKYCLALLHRAAESIGDVMSALKMVIEEYESSQIGDAEKDAGQANSSAPDAEREQRCRELADKMKKLGTVIWQTLHGVVEKVSTYAGGALPANAQQIVRSQLTSMPYRWQRSTAASEAGSSSEVKNANRMLAFAKEGLDMMGQVSKVVDGTIVSAERWLDRMGKKPRRDEEESSEKDGMEKLMGVVPTDPYGYPRPEKQ